jgi:hypothetical protein
MVQMMAYTKSTNNGAQAKGAIVWPNPHSLSLKMFFWYMKYSASEWRRLNAQRVDRIVPEMSTVMAIVMHVIATQMQT